MSIIRGQGWGDKHDWERPDELQYWMTINGHRILAHPTSVCRCLRCGVIFRHHYHEIIDIFKAMEAADVPGRCDDKTIIRQT